MSRIGHPIVSGSRREGGNEGDGTRVSGGLCRLVCVGPAWVVALWVEAHGWGECVFVLIFPV